MRFVQPLRQRISSRFRLKAFLLGCLFAFLFITAGTAAWVHNQVKEVILPGISIDGIDVSLKTPTEAIALLEQEPVLSSHLITLTADTTSLASSAAQLGLQRDVEKSVSMAFAHGHTNSLVEDLHVLWHSYTSGYQITTPVSYDETKVREFVNAFATQIDTPARPPSVELEGSQVLLFPGEIGKQVDVSSTVASLLSTASQKTAMTVPASIQTVGTVLSETEQAVARERAEKLIGKSIHATSNEHTFFFEDDQLVTLLAFPSGYNSQAAMQLLDAVRTEVDRPASNAVFTYDPTTLKVSAFEPDKDGLTINLIETNAALTKAMQQLESSDEKVQNITLSVQAKPADIQLSDLNSLGINERIGFGESNYKGSISSRIHNVSRASEILNNQIVKPGEEFRFNDALGDVTQATGFKPAYVIKAGQTVLGDGGGVCQVSTTLFRALLDSGLNISKRRPHSYRVGYYEQAGRIGDFTIINQPGFDATVYSGEVDVRFVNDSPGHVLIHYEVDPATQHMVVSIYGTSDGRQTEISEYKSWGAQKAPPAQYIDDPTLPPGKLVQIDWAVSGIKSSFKHTIKDKDGKVVREDVYSSNYIPWAAKYRRGI